MDGVYGFLANAVSVVLFNPIDVLKTNYQINQTNDVRLKSPEIIKNIYKSKGLFGFYNGVVPAISTYPIFWSVYFGSNEYFKSTQLLQNDLADKFIKAYVSATLGSTLTNPLFVIKTRLQQGGSCTTVVDVVKKVNTLGASAYFKGLGSTCLNNTKLGVQFPLYDYIKELTNSVVLASLSSKIISSTLFYPLDLIRVNQRSSDLKLTSGDVCKVIYRSGGVFGLYRGVMLYHLTTVPNFTVMMVIFEYFKRCLSS